MINAFKPHSSRIQAAFKPHSSRIQSTVKWIERRKGYSNPLFALLLVVNVFIFPSYHAAAAIDEPAQSTATTPQQVQDAVDAIEVGVSPTDAFLENPIPIRDWGKNQKHIYESLFDQPYHFDDAIYILNEEITIADEFAQTTGITTGGDSYNLELLLIVEYDYLNDNDLPIDEKAGLYNANANVLGFTGVISTENNSVYINGAVFQADRPDGTRNRSMIIRGLSDASVVQTLQQFHSFGLAENEEDHPNPDQQADCDIAFQIAYNNYRTAFENAVTNYRACMDAATSQFANQIAACVALGVAAGLTAALSGLAPVAVHLGGLAAAGCIAAVMGADNSALSACSLALNAAIANAENNYANARANARLQFGEENCPGEPV